MDNYLFPLMTSWGGSTAYLILSNFCIVFCKFCEQYIWMMSQCLCPESGRILIVWLYISPRVSHSFSDTIHGLMGTFCCLSQLLTRQHHFSITRDLKDCVVLWMFVVCFLQCTFITFPGFCPKRLYWSCPQKNCC